MVVTNLVVFLQWTEKEMPVDLQHKHVFFIPLNWYEVASWIYFDFVQYATCNMQNRMQYDFI